MRGLVVLAVTACALAGCAAVYVQEPPYADELGPVPEALGGYWRNFLDTSPIIYHVTTGEEGKIAAIDRRRNLNSELYRQEVALRCGMFEGRNVCVAGPGDGVVNTLPEKGPVPTPESARWAVGFLERRPGRKPASHATGGVQDLGHLRGLGGRKT